MKPEGAVEPQRAGGPQPGEAERAGEAQRTGEPQRAVDAQRAGEAQRAVELILARQLAAALVVPVLLVDARGDTLFYNEPAEAVFGRPFDEIDELSFEERTAILAPLDENGLPLPIDALPGLVAMRERRPAHEVFHMHGLDGVLRPIEGTGIPLESAGGHLLGALVVLWQRPTGGPPSGPP